MPVPKQIIQPIYGLPNCVLINNVAHFYQATKPTQRSFLVNNIVTNSPLVVGDKWYSTTDLSDYYFLGTDWGSALYTNSISPNVFGGIIGNTELIAETKLSSKILVEQVRWFGTLGAVNDASNYYAIRPMALGKASPTLFYTFSNLGTTASLSPNTTFDITYQVNTVYDLNQLTYTGLGYNVYRIGSASSSGLFSNIIYSYRYLK